MSEARTAFAGGLMTLLGPISLSLYTPALPALVAAFQTTASSMRFTFAVYFLGYALAQLISGPLSDAYGRRPVAIAFFSVFLVGSLIAAFAATVDLLLVGRGLQGVGVAAGIVVARATVRDQFVGQASARILNFIGLLMGIGPALAPTLGALLLSVADWHAIFLFMVASALPTLIFLAFYFPETNTSRDRSVARPQKIVRNYRILLGHKDFVQLGVILGLTHGGLYTLSPLLAFVLIDDLGLHPGQFGLVISGQPLAYVLGAALAARLLRSREAIVLVPFGLAIIGTAGLAFLVSFLHGRPSTLGVMMPVAGWAFGFALVQPGVTTLALAKFPANAGSAAALTGFLQIGGGVAGSAVAALFVDATVALAAILPSMALLAILT